MSRFQEEEPQGGEPEEIPPFEHYEKFVGKSEKERDWLERSGNFWKRARLGVGLNREQLAKRIRTPKADLALFEVGLVDQEIFFSDLPMEYAEVLGNRDLYYTYLREFFTPKFNPQE